MSHSARANGFTEEDAEANGGEEEKERMEEEEKEMMMMMTRLERSVLPKHKPEKPPIRQTRTVEKEGSG